MKKVAALLLIIVISTSINNFAQVNKDKGKYVDYQNEFWNYIVKEADSFKKIDSIPKLTFKMDFAGMDLPKLKSEFKYYWHFDPILYPQARTGTCWSFSTTSFYESEIYRLQKKEIKLSEIYTAYWEYVEKAKGYIQERGNSHFAEGSESNALVRIWSKYGVVPLEVYTGLKQGQKFHDHEQMAAEMKLFLESLKETNNWNEEFAISTIKSILNHYLGTPPEKFNYDGKSYTPKDFFDKVCKINFDDYVEVLSTLEDPFYQKVELKVPDNWWHSKDYYNIPLGVFMNVVKEAIRTGYTLAIGGDVSEAGLESHAKVALVPSFDIPSEYIDQYSRQFRIANGTTEDDHGIHLVGYLEKAGKDWYLIKDSGSGSRSVGDKGYYFYSEDFVKLKMLGFTVHKDIFRKLVKEYKD
ncbi:MAG: C1 family peptidase [bacterium]